MRPETHNTATMKRILSILAVIILAASQSARADFMTSMRQNIVPPSPTSSCFAKYTGQQPSMTTGAVRIDVPIYTISAFGYEMPVSIAYTSNGVRVNDDPYPCGYGWTLLPGLRITRTVMGRPDEEVSPEKFIVNPPVEAYDHEFFRNCVSDANELYDKRIDTEHDIFTLNLPTSSCTFMALRENGAYRVIHNSDDMLRIDMSAFPSSITVTDGKGVRYLFSGDDAHTERPNWRSNAITAWALTEITLDNGERITFSWEKHSHNATTNVVLNAYTLKDHFNRNMVPGHKHDSESADGSSDYVLILPDGTSISGNYNGYMHLSGIKFPGGRVSFSYMSENDPYLLEVIVYDSGGRIVKTATMGYSPDTHQGKLLESVNLSGIGTYRFDYNPQRFEAREAQDFWGFYNGVTENRILGSLTPLMRFRASNGKAYESWVTIGAADRHIDTAKMQANMLTRVTYPTGGHTSFEYEPHHLNWTMPDNPKSDIDPAYRESLEYGGGLRLKRAVTSAGDIGGVSMPDVVREYRYGDDGNDRAECVAYPDLETFIDGHTGCEYAYTGDGRINPNGCQFRTIYFTSASNCLDIHIGETPIWYGKVTEICAEGKTEHVNAKLVATTWESTGQTLPHTLRFHSNLNAVFSKGIVNTTQKVYESCDGGYKPVCEKRFDYQLTDIDDEYSYLPSMQVKRNIHCSRGRYAPDIEFDEYGYVNEMSGNLNDSYAIDTNAYGQTYDYGLYSVALKTERLYAETAMEFVARDTIVSTTSRQHIGLLPIVKSVTVSCSDGSAITTRYDYPFAVANGEPDAHREVLEDMRGRNVVSIPYKVTTEKGAAVSVEGKVFARYGDNMFRPAKDYIVKRGDTIVAHDFDYNAKGNIRSVTYFGGQSEAYVWTPDNLYPASVFSGITYSRLVSIVPESSLPTGEIFFPSIFEDLRANLKGDCIFTVYGYRPLIGISSVTDMNGLRTSYTYDLDNRLSGISIDGYGKLKSYSYHLHGDGNGGGENKIITRTYRAENMREHVDTVTYFDGLGRPVQTITGLTDSSLPSSPMADYIQYDAMGRVQKSWLPAPYAGSGEPVPFDDFRQASVDAHNDNHPYKHTEYERSPLERAVRVTGAGDAWHNLRKGTTSAVMTNSTDAADYKCHRYTVEGDGSLKLQGLYARGTLRVSEVTDEDGRRSITFKDLQGRTVLSRRGAGTSLRSDTYYVTDDYGDLRYVLPPEASATMTAVGQSWTKDSEPISKYGYCYDYDVAGNITRKQLPGNVTTDYRYDRASKPVLTQDGNQRDAGRWMLHLYDRFGRQAVTATSAEPLTERQLDSITDRDLIVLPAKARQIKTIRRGKAPSDTIFGPIYQLVRYPEAEDIDQYIIIDRATNKGARLPSRFTPVDVSYYDDYSFQDSLSAEDRQRHEPRQMAGADNIQSELIGALTGRRLACFGLAGRTLLSVNRYDRLGRLVQTGSDNLSGCVDYTGCAYSFTGMPTIQEKAYNNASAGSKRFALAYGYDAGDRMLLLELADSVEHRTQLQRNTYDGLGRLRNAVLGNGAVGIDYEYNLRGWTTNVTSNVFSQLIHFQDPPDGGSPCFNGNISAIVWDQSATGNAVARHGEYRYAYDGLDRLIAANYTGIDNCNHSCLYAYDCMGNATSIKRYGITDRIDLGGTTSCSYGVIDDVTLTYNGNRLVCADDAADALVYEGAMDFHDGANEQTEYAYDANGNLTKDLNRGIESITYDRNNMPTEITFASGARTCYTYDADGRKLRVCHYGRRGEKRDELDYIGDIVLRNGALERTLTPNGYIVNDTVYYYVKDYQGNVRSVVREDGAVVESNEYYPYGGLFTATPSVQPYKYGSKELDRTHGLDWYDSQARWVNPMSGMTSTMDRLAEKYYHLSPHLWCGGNPIKNIDENGDTLAVLHEFMHIALLVKQNGN